MKTGRFILFALLLAFSLSASLSTALADENRRHDAGRSGVHSQQRDHGDRGVRTGGHVERRDYLDRDRGERHVERREDRGWRSGYVLDRRYHHDRYYPPRGYRVQELPRGYRFFRYHGGSYYFWNGVWYRPSGFGFVVVVPPVGLVIPVLPSYYTMVWVGGVPYYYAGDVYYVWRPNLHGYMVTQLPSASGVITQPPAEIPSQSSDTDQFYVYPKRGQSADQQAKDRYECHRWAVGQTGFDPSQPAGNVTATQLDTERTDYRRAITACLDARGYSVK